MGDLTPSLQVYEPLFQSFHTHVDNRSVIGPLLRISVYGLPLGKFIQVVPIFGVGNGQWILDGVHICKATWTYNYR